MTTRTTVTWTCDRCGRDVEQYARLSSPEQPHEWGALYLVQPPLMSPADSTERPDQVCGDCVSSFIDWFNAGKA